MVIEGEEIINSLIDANKIIDRTLNQVKTILGEKDSEIGRLRTEIENLNKKSLNKGRRRKKPKKK